MAKRQLKRGTGRETRQETQHAERSRGTDAKPDVRPAEREEVSLMGALRVIGGFLSDHRQQLLLGLTVLLLLIPIFLSFHYRAYGAELVAVDRWAEQNVLQNVRSTFESMVRQEFPNLPDAGVTKMVNDRMERLAAGQEYVLNTPDGQIVLNQAFVDRERQRSADYFRSQLQHEDGYTYLGDLDSYQHLRYVENILEHGYPGDVKLADGTMLDDHKYAPIGVETRWQFHTWFMAKWHQAVTALFGDRPAMTTFYWMPVIFSLLAVIPAFFISRRKGGLLAAFFTAMLVAVHPAFLGRTLAGAADTDAFIVFFPLVAAFFFLEAYEAPAGRWLRRVAFLALTGATFGLFAFTWNYWWFFFDLFVLTLLAQAGFNALRETLLHRSLTAYLKGEQFRWWLVMFVGFLLAVALFVVPIKGIGFLTAPLGAVSTAEGIKSAVNTDTLWPNVLTTVAELNVPSISKIVGSIGGKLLFVIALLGMVSTLVSDRRLGLKDWLTLGFGLLAALFLVSPSGMALSVWWFLIIMALPVVFGLLLRLTEEEEVDAKYALFLFVWMAASVFTMTKGVRFVLLLLPPFAVAAGVAVGFVYRHLRDRSDRVGVPVMVAAPALFILLSLLLIPTVTEGRAVGMQGAPTMSDGWWNALSKIDREAAPDAIINSWWDFGHWFKYVGDRAVTFDGASQNTPMAHWIGRVLLTSDEKEALGILRMLDCGSQLGAEEVRVGLRSDDLYEAVMLTKEIIMLPPAEARATLLDHGFSEEEADGVLNHTHCAPPENYFITSGDMVGKGGVWGHFGGWDFAKADAYRNFRLLPVAEAVPAMTAKYGWDEEAATDIHFRMQGLNSQEAVNAWISPWPGYISQQWAKCVPMGENSTDWQCGLRVGVGESNGQDIVLEGVVLNGTELNRSFVVLGSYRDGRLGGQMTDLVPSSFVLVRNGTVEELPFEGKLVGFSFLVDLDSSAPRIMMLDPSNVGSLFTRLYFLDGKGTTAFEKFTEEGSINMGQIKVWKVDWSKLETYGLV